MRPSGMSMATATQIIPIEMEGGAAGHTLNINMRLGTPEQGDYWFSFFVDDVLATKIPIRITLGEPVLLEPLESASTPQTQLAPDQT
jgi:hypothetical protein